MRTISLDQPWASAMALGLKKIETRGTRILGRGPTAIHGAKKWDEDLEYEAADFSRLFNAPGLIDAPRGYIIAVGRIEIGRAHAELQSLMRISYAVFCLKKKNTKVKSLYSIQQ